MKKLFYYISRIFFSKEKVLLMRLLNEISSTLIRDEDGVVRMSSSGMCLYINGVVTNHENYMFLHGLIMSHAPKKMHSESHFFEQYAYEPRFEFLKTLIKKY